MNFSSLANWMRKAVFTKWIIFNSLALIWFIVAFPLLYILVVAESSLNPIGKGILYVFIFIVSGLFIYLDKVKFDVAERNPRTFLKIERAKTFFVRIYWLLIYFPSIVLVLMYLFLPRIFPTSTLNRIAPVFVPLFILYGLVLFGSTFYLLGMIGNVRQQPRVLKARAEASFRVLSELLSNPLKKPHGGLVRYFLRTFTQRRSESIEAKKELIRLFDNGINCLNALFWYLYGFEFCSYSKYCDYFRLVIWTEDSLERNRIRKVLDMFGCKLRQEIDVSDILWTTRQLLKPEQIISKEELLQDLDFKTGMNKWYSRHREGVTLLLLTVPIILSVLALFLSFHL
jgi:hypothetical protein